MENPCAAGHLPEPAAQSVQMAENKVSCKRMQRIPADAKKLKLKPTDHLHA